MKHDHYCHLQCYSVRRSVHLVAETPIKGSPREEIQPVNERYDPALEYRLYRVVNKLSKKDEKDANNIAKSGKRTQMRVGSHRFDVFNFISFLSFLSALKMAYDAN